jgi:predicted Rossmann fold flavoprotein
MQTVDVIIIGAGAAGLMCAIEAGKRGKKVVVLDHTNKPGKKILMSGGGRCNFTNIYTTHEQFISHNPHFCKSALSRYTPWDFIALVKKYHIPYHEKTLGQLFCDHKSKDILDMLLMECEFAKVDIRMNAKIDLIEHAGHHHFKIKSTRGDFHCQSLVVATGGLSIPTMGASPYGYHIAEQFGIKVWPTRAGLVPLTLHQADKEKLSILAGISIDSSVNVNDQSFRENILFTHRGLSGPAILQISSYWTPGDELHITMMPDINLYEQLKIAQREQPLKHLKNWLADIFTKRVVDVFLSPEIADKALHSISHIDFAMIAKQFQPFTIKPNGTEGYRTAEVTLGGVDSHAFSSKTMEANATPGLYFIGEVLDVTGWLGGFNFQWAWASGWAAGQVV